MAVRGGGGAERTIKWSWKNEFWSGKSKRKVREFHFRLRVGTLTFFVWLEWHNLEHLHYVKLMGGFHWNVSEVFSFINHSVVTNPSRL